MNDKNLRYSIVILIFGWLYFFIIDYLNYNDFIAQFKDGLLINIPRSGKYDTIWTKLIGIGFGIASLYFSYRINPQNHAKSRILLISLGFILIVLSIITFPNFIFQYLI